MPFVQATRSLGRAGLFSLTVLRGSLPTRDFLAELTREIYKIGARSLPIIAVGGAFVGLVLTLQGYRTLTTFGAADALSTLLGLSLYRELAPVLTALLFIGRAGSSIAAELGLMRATDQIKALELMAIDPVAKAVAPRFWAAVLTVPLLTGIFCFAGDQRQLFRSCARAGPGQRRVLVGAAWQRGLLGRLRRGDAEVGDLRRHRRTGCRLCRFPR